MYNLIIDKYFNIYNRNGFDYIIKNIKPPYKIYLIDLNDIKKLNEEIGYLEVNKIIKNTFNNLKEKYVIGRAFSGDEIFLLTSNINGNISDIKIECEKNGLEFDWIESIYEGGDIELFLEKMISKFR